MSVRQSRIAGRPFFSTLDAFCSGILMCSGAGSNERRFTLHLFLHAVKDVVRINSPQFYIFTTHIVSFLSSQLLRSESVESSDV